MDEITEEKIEEMIKTEGRVKGEVFKTDAEYVLEKKGEKGLKILQKETEKLGSPIDYRKIKSADWYPVGLRVVSLLAAMRAFGWQEKEIEKMGASAPKISFIVRIFMKFFLSPEKVAKISPKLWPRHYTIGSLKIVNFRERQEKQEIKGSVMVELRDFKVHPILCAYLGGYFLAVATLSAPYTKAIIKETKCPFRGDQYHQYLCEWTRPKSS